MIHSSPLVRRVLAGVLALTLIAGVPGPGPTAAHPHPTPKGIRQFMWAVGLWESGGSYTARNKQSLAYGKYQIMPLNWPVWAKRYIGNAKAPQSPVNQERVARAKMIDLYHWLGKWDWVAYWWLTGKTDHNRKKWSLVARRYVSGIMSLYRDALRRRLPGAPYYPIGKRVPALPTSRSTGSVYVRRTPSAASRIVGSLPPGKQVYVRGTVRGPGGRLWLRVRFHDGRTGWVSTKHMTPPRR